jgi:hypothetical protein
MSRRPDRSVQTDARLRMRSATAAAAVLLVAGCSGESGETESPPPSPEPAVDEILSELERSRPGVVLQDFVRAAARGDEGRMWERLSAPSRRRLGPSLPGFRRRAAPQLELELASLGRRHRLTLSQAVTSSFAVAAVGRASQIYAAALRLEDGLWGVELGGSMRIEPLRPKPGETVVRRTQLAAEVTAGSPIVEAGLWLDGLAFPSRGGGASPNTLTMFGETASLAGGAHTVVAFASTNANASARAWAFRAQVR